ncbi:MAG: CapA family protein, partial [Anaerolineae bacterium]
PPATPKSISTATSQPPTATATSSPIPPTATQIPTATIDPNYEIHIAAVGDIMLARGLGEIISGGNPAYPFEKMEPWLVPADITVGNFESALGTLGQPIEGKSFPFQASPEVVEALKLGGFDVVSLANNHALDYGSEALLDGIELLQAAGIEPVGAGSNAKAARAPVIIDVNGVKLAFLAYVNVLPEESGFDVAIWEATETEPGLAWGRPEEIAADVARAKQSADHVIVLLHSGIEYLRFITPEQQDQARSAIDAGASLVVGHHAHILQKVEEYKGGLIAYGLGNFAFDIDGDPSTLILHAWLSQNGVARFELIPAVIRPGGQPRPATAEEGREILGQIGR